MAAIVAPIVALCDEAASNLPPGPLLDEVLAIRERLGGPLRVAVAGRLKAGKSTLVNALVGERIAPTGVGECTKVLTWFSYGFPERVTVELVDGPARDLPLGSAFALPEELGADPAEVTRVRVSLSIEALRAMTIVDTPGLASSTEAASAATRELLAIDAASRRGIGEADAIVYLLDQAATREDVEALAAVRRSGGGLRASALNTVAVLSKVDLLGEPDEIEGRARAVARRHADTLRTSVAAVVPVVGLLAETLETGRFAEADAAALRRLAALDAASRARLLLSADRFVTSECDVPASDRQRLVDRLGLYGVSVALGAVERGASSSADLAETLRAVSGIAELRALLDRSFGRQAAALQADRALTALERLAYVSDPTGPSLHRLRDAIERVRLEPDLHVLAELRALQDCEDDASGVPEELRAELLRLVLEPTDAARLGLAIDADPASIAAAAAAGASRWRAFVNGGSATPQALRVAEVTGQSHELIWARASASRPA